MISYPNQKIITTQKQKSEIGGDVLYTTFLQSAGKYACEKLTKISSLKLWIYLEKNSDGYQFALSPKDCEAWGISRDAYKAGVAELISKGFIRHQEGNYYVFCDGPDIEDESAEATAKQKAKISTEKYLDVEEQKAKNFFESRREEMYEAFERDGQGENDDDRLPYETDEDYVERKKQESQFKEGDKKISKTYQFLMSLKASKEQNRMGSDST